LQARHSYREELAVEAAVEEAADRWVSQVATEEAAVQGEAS
jgi:hypothetical protein